MIGGWSGLARCSRTMPSYFRGLAQYQVPVQYITKMPPSPPPRSQCRLDSAVRHSSHQFTPSYPSASSEVSRCCPQVHGSPYPHLRTPAGAHYFDALGDASWCARSDWVRGRWRHAALSPTVEELSAGAGTPTTTSPVSRRHAAGTDDCLHCQRHSIRHRSTVFANILLLAQIKK